MLKTYIADFLGKVNSYRWKREIYMWIREINILDLTVAEIWII